MEYLWEHNLKRLVFSGYSQVENVSAYKTKYTIKNMLSRRISDCNCLVQRNKPFLLAGTFGFKND